MNTIEAGLPEESEAYVRHVNEHRKQAYESHMLAIQYLVAHPDEDSSGFAEKARQIAQAVLNKEIKFEEITPEMLGVAPLPDQKNPAL